MYQKSKEHSETNFFPKTFFWNGALQKIVTRIKNLLANLTSFSMRQERSEIWRNNAKISRKYTITNDHGRWDPNGVHPVTEHTVPQETYGSDELVQDMLLCSCREPLETVCQLFHSGCFLFIPLSAATFRSYDLLL